MAVARIIATQITPDEYDMMRERLGVGDSPPDGASLHVGSVGEDGKVRIFEVWDSREQAEAWGEKVAAARDAAGIGGGSPPSIEYQDVHFELQR